MDCISDYSAPYIPDNQVHFNNNLRGEKKQAVFQSLMLCLTTDEEFFMESNYFSYPFAMPLQLA